MSDARDVVSRQVRLLRTLAIGGAGIAAGLLQGVAASLPGLALVVLGTAAWMVGRSNGTVHRYLTRAAPWLPDRVAQISFVLLGVLMVWRLVFSWLPLAIGGMWMLVAAMDLDRLATRFPRHGSRTVQRSVLRTHLRGLALVALASAGAGIVACVVTIRLQLFAVVLLAVLIVLVVRHVSAGIVERAAGAGEGGNDGNR